MNHKKFTLLFFFSFIALFSFGQTNLIVNPGAEEDLTVGWTIVTAGQDCFGGVDWRIQGGHSGYPTPHSGDWYFTSGCGNVSGEIYQDVDVSSMASEIDAGTAGFHFSFWLQNFNQSPPDEGRVVVSYFSEDMDTLAKYDSGPLASISVWTQYKNYTVAPAGTRTIRITVLSIARNGGAVDAYFDDLMLYVVDAMPVVLTSFDTKVEGSRVRASWQTATESNSDYFELERSTNATDWQSVGKTNAAGNSANSRDYTLIDASPLSGTSYYRLKQVDRDGKTSFSKVNSIHFAGAASALKIYPNPAVSFINLEGSGLSQFKVYNAAGSDVTSLIRISEKSNKSVKLDVSALSKGTYFVKTKETSVSFYKQ